MKYSVIEEEILVHPECLPTTDFSLGVIFIYQHSLRQYFFLYGIENLILSSMFILLCVYCSLMKVVVTENLERKYSDPENLS